jgi:hypothetical protein
MVYGELTDKDWEEVAQAAHIKLWNDDWQEEEVEEPDMTLRGIVPDFVGHDGYGRSVLVLVKVIRHPRLDGSER